MLHGSLHSQRRGLYSMSLMCHCECADTLKLTHSNTSRYPHIIWLRHTCQYPPVWSWTLSSWEHCWQKEERLFPTRHRSQILESPWISKSHYATPRRCQTLMFGSPWSKSDNKQDRVMCFNSFWKQYRIIKNNLNSWLYLNKQVYLMQTNKKLWIHQTH